MRKILLTISLFGLLSLQNVFANCIFENSTFEDERKESYFWACNEGIISESNISNAKMDKELTRIEMAKMLNIFSMKIMGKEEDPSRTCNGYSDLTNYNDISIANRSCHLGIMGIGIDKFRPNDSVSRAEFGTVLSRILRGDKYNVSEGYYYKLHLKALKDNGIITNDNPNLKEMKGYVLLMLKRYIDRIEKENKTIENSVTVKNNNGYIYAIGNDVTLSNHTDTITINNKPVASDGKRSDSLQGPCAPGYHVPSKDEAVKLVDIWGEIRKDDLPQVTIKSGSIQQKFDTNNEYNDLIGDMFLSDIGVLGNVNISKIFMKGEQKMQMTTFWTRSKSSEYSPYSLKAEGYSVYVGEYCGLGCKLNVICFKTK